MVRDADPRAEGDLLNEENNTNAEIYVNQELNELDLKFEDYVTPFDEKSRIWLLWCRH